MNVAVVTRPPTGNLTTNGVVNDNPYKDIVPGTPAVMNNDYYSSGQQQQQQQQQQQVQTEFDQFLMWKQQQELRHWQHQHLYNNQWSAASPYPPEQYSSQFQQFQLWQQQQQQQAIGATNQTSTTINPINPSSTGTGNSYGQPTYGSNYNHGKQDQLSPSSMTPTTSPNTYDSSHYTSSSSTPSASNPTHVCPNSGASKPCATTAAFSSSPPNSSSGAIGTTTTTTIIDDDNDNNSDHHHSSSSCFNPITSIIGLMGVATTTMNNITTTNKKTSNAVTSMKTAFTNMQDTIPSLGKHQGITRGCC
jgi:hypothetical protein